MNAPAAPNADAAELRHFDELARHWWDPRGPMATLHEINPVRIAYMHQRVGALDGLRVVDVGCGGGILGEALATEGATVTGIDLAADTVAAAQAHAREHDSGAQYRCIPVADFAAQQPGQFDLVCCLEMLEHVPDPAAILAACATLVRPGGDVILSTINRNPKSFAMMIAGAEYALRLIPRGTHDYAKFIRPSELMEWAQAAGLEAADVCGMRYNPWLRRARLVPRDVDVNYLMHCRRSA